MSKLRIKLTKSLIGRKPKHIEIIKSLGLTKMHSMIEQADTPSIRGMIKQVDYLVQVEEIKK